MVTLRLVLRAWLAARWKRLTCRHCYHPADPMIMWMCCHCRTDRDGFPLRHRRSHDCEWGSRGRPKVQIKRAGTAW